MLQSGDRWNAILLAICAVVLAYVIALAIAGRGSKKPTTAGASLPGVITILKLTRASAALDQMPSDSILGDVISLPRPSWVRVDYLRQ